MLKPPNSRNRGPCSDPLFPGLVREIKAFIPTCNGFGDHPTAAFHGFEMPPQKKVYLLEDFYSENDVFFYEASIIFWIGQTNAPNKQNVWVVSVTPAIAGRGRRGGRVSNLTIFWDKTGWFALFIQKCWLNQYKTHINQYIYIVLLLYKPM